MSYHAIKKPGRASSSSTGRRKSPVRPIAKAGKPVKVAKSKIVVPGNRGIKVVRSVTVLASAAELYSFFKDVTNLKAIVSHPVTIVPVSEVQSRWTTWTKQGAGKEIAWDVIVINDEPDALIAWRSREGDPVVHAGSVRFEPAPRGEGTKVTIALEYDPPRGRIGAVVAWLNRESASQCVHEALRSLKTLKEAGKPSAASALSKRAKSGRLPGRRGVRV